MSDLDKLLAKPETAGYLRYEKEKSFDPRIFQLTNLGWLYIHLCKFEEIPDGIEVLGRLHTLGISKTPLRQLPRGLSKLKRLTNFSLVNTAVQELPKELGACEELRILHLEGNQIKKIPDWLKQLRHLEELDISENPLEAFPHAIFKLPFLEACKCRKVAIFHDNFKQFNINSRFFTALRKERVADELAYPLYRLLEGNPDKCSDLPIYTLLYASQFPETIIKTTALEIIKQKADANWQQKPLGKGSHLAVLGRIPQKAKNLAEQLKPLAVVIDKTINEKTTHIVVGGSLKEDAMQTVQNTDKCWLLPSHIEQFLAESDAYFLRPAQPQDNSEQAANVAAMLNSPDESNLQLALELLERNGLPPELITDIFLILKNHKQPLTLRNKARSLLKANASPALLQKLSNPRKLFIRSSPEMGNLRFYLANTELDWRKIRDFLLRIGIAKRAVEEWLAILPIEQAKAELAALCKKTNYTFVASYVPVRMRDELLKVPTLRRINLGAVANFPKAIFNLKELEWLSLTYLNSRSLKALPQLKELPMLAELEITRHFFSEFPAFLYDIPQLKTIRITDSTIPKDSINADIFDVSQWDKKGVLKRKTDK